MDPSQFLNKMVTVQIDRMLGSRHPQRGFRYPVNYGFLPGVISPDGEELDAYVLGVTEPVDEFTGQVIAVIHRLDDDDDKLVVVLPGSQFNDEEINALTDFQERYFRSTIVRS